MGSSQFKAELIQAVQNPAERRGDHAFQAPSFQQGQVPRAGAYVAVMGVTGAGKSTFISKCIERPEEVAIGEGMDPCTQEVEHYLCKYTPPGGQPLTVCLLDTPGFDDNMRSDREILQDISVWLSQSYQENVKLSGVVYLHQITDAKMKGSALRNLIMFQRLCGKDAFHNVILATTKWEDVAAHGLGESRESELRTREDWWGGMLQRGSRCYRHQNTRESAMRLLGLILDQTGVSVPLKIQMEMVDDKKSLNQTSAGRELDAELIEERAKHLNDLKMLREDMLAAQKSRDREAEEQLRKQQGEHEETIRQLDVDRQKMQMSLQEMQSDRTKKEMLEKQVLELIKISKDMQEEHLQRQQELQQREQERHERQWTAQQADMRTFRDEQRRLQEELQAARQQEFELRKKEETLQQQIRSSSDHDIHSCKEHRRCKWAAKLDKKLQNQMSRGTN